MKVNRLIRAVLLLLTLIFCLTSCKGEERLSVEEISASLEELCFSGQEVYEISKADIENRFNFDGNLLEECAIKLSKNEQNFLMVAVLQLKEDTDRAVITEGINATVKAASASFSVLGNSTLARIQQRLYYEYEDILIVVICENYDGVKNYLDSIGAKTVE